MVLYKLVALLAGLTITGPQAERAQQKPVKVQISQPDYRAAPDSLSEMIEVSDLVVVGEVLGSEPHDRVDQLGTFVRTLFRVDLETILHDDSPAVAVESPLKLLQDVGDRDRGAYIERNEMEGFPRFRTKHRYVMFLTWNEALKAWVPAFGPDSFVDLTSGVGAIVGKSRAIRGLKDRTASDVIDAVKRQGR
jgi:hypothetical protein